MGTIRCVTMIRRRCGYGIANYDVLIAKVRMRSESKLEPRTKYEESNPLPKRSSFVRLLKDPLCKTCIRDRTFVDHS